VQFCGALKLEGVDTSQRVSPTGADAAENLEE